MQLQTLKILQWRGDKDVADSAQFAFIEGPKAGSKTVWFVSVVTAFWSIGQEL